MLIFIIKSAWCNYKYALSRGNFLTSHLYLLLFIWLKHAWHKIVWVYPFSWSEILKCYSNVRGKPQSQLLSKHLNLGLPLVCTQGYRHTRNNHAVATTNELINKTIYHISCTYILLFFQCSSDIAKAFKSIRK